MRKRNRYFEELGITTVTFTDVDACFEEMEAYLARAAEHILQRELDQFDDGGSRAMGRGGWGG